MTEKLQTRPLILLIDDEDAVRDLAGFMFDRIGYDCISAGEGEQGLNLFRQNRDRIAGVVVDMTMPCMNGIELLKQLQEEGVDVPVFLASGYRDEDIPGASSAGFTGYIAKPFTLASLREALQDHIGQ